MSDTQQPNPNPKPQVEEWRHNELVHSAAQPDGIMKKMPNRPALNPHSELGALSGGLLVVHLSRTPETEDKGMKGEREEVEGGGSRGDKR
eukprot:scaffold181265_cov31-Tisochrysis_lutea.AAC.3